MVNTVGHLAPVRFTDAALKELKALLQKEEHAEEKYLLLGVKGGGCAGFTYVIEFGVPDASLKTYMVDDFPIAIDPAHELYLTGTAVDFELGLNNRGFTFNNPNAESTCGCGSSFG